MQKKQEKIGLTTFLTDSEKRTLLGNPNYDTSLHTQSSKINSTANKISDLEKVSLHLTNEKLLSEERKRNQKFVNKLIIPIDHNWIICWEILMLALVFYSCLTNIFFISFHEHSTGFNYWLDVFFECIF